jgi:DNA replication and repair protein RecF
LLRLTRITLTEFRSYPTLVWRPASDVVVISGPNGSGKTNLLEAMSLLVPGRGLRGARMAELARRGGPGRWAVAGRFATGSGPVDIGTGTPPEGPAERRAFRLDGAVPRSQAEIAAQVAAVWLTPQMERLFAEPASGRRRFLDRLVWALAPGHAREVAAHDTAMAQRNRLLAEGGRDPAWLAGLEDAMARHGVAVAAGRLALAERLNAALAGGSLAGFPKARISVVCPIAERLAEQPALAVEDWLRARLAAARRRDAEAGGALWGAHRGDMALSDAQSGLAAAQASTGQQKALLVGVVLGHAALIAAARGAAPLLLLDEPAVHLDAARRQALFAALAALPAQSFVTGTDAELFAPLRGVAEGWIAGDGALRADPSFAAFSASPGADAPAAAAPGSAPPGASSSPVTSPAGASSPGRGDR